jgi:hypothetical protein
MPACQVANGASRCAQTAAEMPKWSKSPILLMTYRQNVAAGTLRWPESKMCAAWAERVSFVHCAHLQKLSHSRLCDCIWENIWARVGLTHLQRKGPKRALAVKQEVVRRRRRILHDKALGAGAHAFSLYWRWNSKVSLCSRKQEVSNFGALSPKKLGTQALTVKKQYL